MSTKRDVMNLCHSISCIASFVTRLPNMCMGREMNFKTQSHVTILPNRFPSSRSLKWRLQHAAHKHSNNHQRDIDLEMTATSPITNRDRDGNTNHQRVIDLERTATSPITNRDRDGNAFVGVPLAQDTFVTKSTHATNGARLALLLGMNVAAVGFALIRISTELNLPALVVLLSATSGVLIFSFFALWFAFKYGIVEDDDGTDGGNNPNDEEIWGALINHFTLGFISGHIVSVGLLHGYTKLDAIAFIIQLLLWMFSAMIRDFQVVRFQKSSEVLDNATDATDNANRRGSKLEPTDPSNVYVSIV